MEREVEVIELECPFCGHKDFLKVKDEVSGEDGSTLGKFYDAWDCTCCGERTELELGAWESEFKEFKYYTENNDWEGLLRFCSSEEFDELALTFLAKNYLQNKDWEKAKNIAEVMLKIDPDDSDGQSIIERINQKDSKVRIKVTSNQLIDAFQCCSLNRLYFLDLKKKELVSYARNLDAVEEEQLKKDVENNPSNFLNIPSKDSTEGFHLMESFIHEIGEHQGQTKAAEVLSSAIQHSKPFQSFNEVILNYPKIREQWFGFEREVYKEIVLDWVCGNNLICGGEK